jgi:hypothetical protein
VKRWRNAALALRWTAAGMMEAAKGFRRQSKTVRRDRTDWLGKSDSSHARYVFEISC